MVRAFADGDGGTVSNQRLNNVITSSLAINVRSALKTCAEVTIFCRPETNIFQRYSFCIMLWRFLWCREYIKIDFLANKYLINITAINNELIGCWENSGSLS